MNVCTRAHEGTCGRQSPGAGLSGLALFLAAPFLLCSAAHGNITAPLVAWERIDGASDGMRGCAADVIVGGWGDLGIDISLPECKAAGAREDRCAIIAFRLRHGRADIGACSSLAQCDRLEWTPYTQLIFRKRTATSQTAAEQRGPHSYMYHKGDSSTVFVKCDASRQVLPL